MKQLHRAFTFLVVAVLFEVAGCGSLAPAPSVTPLPTATLTPSVTPTPSPTPTPTLTPTRIQDFYERKLMVGSVERTYSVHIPPGADLSKPMPVVLALRGLTSGADGWLGTIAREEADQYGYLGVLPLPANVSWNTGPCCGDDDIGFMRQMLQDLGTFATIDTKRIYAVGFENGGMFAYHLACEMPKTFAGIASVEAGLLYSPCQPQQPVSVMEIHYMRDLWIPYEGGRGGYIFHEDTFPPVEDTIKLWAQLDGCRASPQVERHGKVIHTVYAPCANGSAVELYAVDEAGMGLPSLGEVPATQVIWEFFAAHPKP